MIKLFEVRVDTPVGRRMNLVVAATDQFNAREIAIGMIEDFRGVSSSFYREMRDEATVAEVELTEITKHEIA
jgi:hypothetical protein